MFARPRAPPKGNRKPKKAKPKVLVEPKRTFVATRFGESRRRLNTSISLHRETVLSEINAGAAQSPEERKRAIERKWTHAGAWQDLCTVAEEQREPGTKPYFERNYVLDDAGSLRVAQLSHSEFRPFTDVPPQVPAWQADRVPERISVPAGVWASPEQYRFKVPHRRASYSPRDSLSCSQNTLRGWHGVHFQRPSHKGDSRFDLLDHVPDAVKHPHRTTYAEVMAMPTPERRAHLALMNLDPDSGSSEYLAKLTASARRPKRAAAAAGSAGSAAAVPASPAAWHSQSQRLSRSFSASAGLDAKYNGERELLLLRAEQQLGVSPGVAAFGGLSPAARSHFNHQVHRPQAGFAGFLSDSAALGGSGDQLRLEYATGARGEGVPLKWAHRTREDERAPRAQRAPLPGERTLGQLAGELEQRRRAGRSARDDDDGGLRLSAAAV